MGQQVALGVRVDEVGALLNLLGRTRHGRNRNAHGVDEQIVA